MTRPRSTLAWEYFRDIQRMMLGKGIEMTIQPVERPERNKRP